MICRCYRCERRIEAGGRWVTVHVGKIPIDVFMCAECAKVVSS